MADRQVGKDRTILFGLGLAAGLLGRFAFKQLKARPSMPRNVTIWQREMVQTRGRVKAAFLAARVQARYDELMAHRPRFSHPALNMRLANSILPGLALYEVLREEEGSSDAALAEVDRLFAASVRQSLEHRLMDFVKRRPDPFPWLRVGNRLAMKGFPAEGWRFEWLEDSDRCVAYTVYDCFYLNVLTAFGAPELTAHFCRSDDLLFGDVPGVSWERTKTLGRGDDCCNFRFCRAARP